jgi:SRSO17 transposase
MTAAELERARERLSSFVEEFVDSIGRAERRHWCKLYLAGLLLDGERKSILPIAERVGGDVQALRQFVNQSPWDHEELLRDLRQHVVRQLSLTDGVLILDDVALPKKGKHSVGVAHQYCGALGKTSNCQSIVSWQLSSGEIHIPVIARLYLPKAWTTDSERMDEVGVPYGARTFLEKWRIALILLDELLGELPFTSVTFDAGYGANRDFLHALDERDIHFSGQIACDLTFWDGDAEIDTSISHKSGLGRKRSYAHIADKRLKPKSAKKWGELLFADDRNIHSVDLPLKSGGKATYVAKRMYESVRQRTRVAGPARWLIIERLDDGSFKYYVASNPDQVSAKEALLEARERWKVEQGYQQLKEELGLDHYEGRSWRGLHHHIAMTFMAYDFLQMLRVDRAKKKWRHFADSARDQSLAECACQDHGLPAMRKTPNLGTQATPGFQLEHVTQ